MASKLPKVVRQRIIIRYRQEAGDAPSLLADRLQLCFELFFKLVDLQGTRGIVWEHELYDNFTLNEDRPFFHSFAGDVSAKMNYRCDADAN